MPGRIVAACRESGQEPPATHGEIVRAALELVDFVVPRTAAVRSRYAARNASRVPRPSALATRAGIDSGCMVDPLRGSCARARSSAAS